MNMLDDRARDLINGEIDGVLTDAEKADCEALFEKSEDARAYHRELSRLDALLGQTPAVEPPETLQRRILEQIVLPRPRKWFMRAAGWMQGRPISYGLAAAAGLMVAVAIYELTPGPQREADYSSLVGTLARGAELQGVKPLGSMYFEQDEVSGRMVLSGNDELRLLRFDLTSKPDVEIAVDLAAGGMAFGGFAQQDQGDLGQVAFSGEHMKVSNRGALRFTVIMHEKSDAAENAEGISVSVLRNGEPLFEDLINR